MENDEDKQRSREIIYNHMADTARKFFLRDSGEKQLPAHVVEHLKSIRLEGNRLLARLEPYRFASIHSVSFVKRILKTAKRDHLQKLAEESAQSIQSRMEDLAAAAVYVQERLTRFPVSDRDMETTCVLCGLFSTGALARYGCEALLENEDPKLYADPFIGFFQEKMAVILDESAKWSDAPALHDACLMAYNGFKGQLPDLFEALRGKLEFAQGELMAPYGSKEYLTGWRHRHYANWL